MPLFGRKDIEFEHYSDEQLAERFRATHDNYLCGLLYKRYGHLVLGLCIKYLKNKTEAEDAVMQIFPKLLDDLKKEFDLTYLFIAHNLSVVEYISDRVAVMYLGRIVEIGPSERIFADPKHPYTEALLSCIPRRDYEEALRSLEESAKALGQDGKGFEAARYRVYDLERSLLLRLASLSAEPGYGLLTLVPHAEDTGGEPTELIVPLGAIRQLRLSRVEPQGPFGFSLVAVAVMV